MAGVAGLKVDGMDVLAVKHVSLWAAAVTGSLARRIEGGCMWLKTLRTFLELKAQCDTEQITLLWLTKI
jgi:hypothetical protein